jgi:imidazolonepropionase-like amidohydrolase
MTARTVIEGVRIFDGEAMIGVGTVLIVDGVIAGVIPEVDSPAGEYRADTVIDGHGQTLLPGLIDAHTHISGPDSLHEALTFGVTTELEMFGFPPARTATLRTAADCDDLADLRSSGIMASAPGGFPGIGMPGLPTLNSPDEADDFVAARHVEGSDYIKIFVEDGHARPALDQATIAAVVRAAHRRNLRTIAHAPRCAAIRTAFDAGVDAITHAPLDGALPGDVVAAMAAAGQIAIPTLAMMEAVVAGTSGLPASPAELDFGYAVDAVRAWHRCGVPILAGTDANSSAERPSSVMHGASIHRELALLTQAGLTPVEALAAATSRPALHFGLTDRGRIEVGLRADLLLVRGDPTIDIHATRAISHIWRRGTPRLA